MNKFDSSSEQVQVYPVILGGLCVEEFLAMATPH